VNPTRAAIVAALDELAPPPEQDGRAIVRTLGPNGKCAAGLDGRGWAVLLMPPAASQTATIMLQNLEFSPAASLILCSENHEIERATRAQLACRVDTAAARLAFCIAAAALAEEIDHDQETDVARRIAGFVELFRGLARQVADADVVGLWGELALIAFGVSPDVVANAWHADPSDVLDFELGGSRVEVKTTRDPSRTHWFSGDQLALTQLADVTLASLIAVPSTTGASVADLLELAASRLDDGPLAAHVLAVASRTLGDALWTSDLRFDTDATLSSLRLLPMREIPKVDVRDDRVLEVSWRAALANVAERSAVDIDASALLSALPGRA